MQALNLDSKPAAQYARAAAISASVNSYAASTHYTNRQRLEAERVKIMLSEAVAGRVYITYRKRFVAVKIEQPRTRNSRLLKELEADYAERGYTKTETAQGITYRIPKQG